MTERTLQDIQEQLENLNRNYLSFQKRLSDNLLKLSSQVETIDYRKLAKLIKEQADEAKNLHEIQKHIEVLKEQEREKFNEIESQLPKFESLRSMIESQKQNDIEWFKNKMESNDYSDCTPQEIHMIESGIEEIVKRVTLDAKLRLTKLISQIKDKTGEVITCTVEKNNNGGYDGEITGTKRTVHIQTIVAGGAVQQLHHRTLIK